MRFSLEKQITEALRDMRHREAHVDSPMGRPDRTVPASVPEPDAREVTEKRT